MYLCRKEEYRAKLGLEHERSELTAAFCRDLSKAVVGLAGKWEGKRCNARYFKALDAALGGTPKWCQWNGGHWLYEKFWVKWASCKPNTLDFTPGIPAGSNVRYSDLGSIRVPLTGEDRIAAGPMADELAKGYGYWAARAARLHAELESFGALFDELYRLKNSVAAFREAHGEFFWACEGGDGWGYRP